MEVQHWVAMGIALITGGYLKDALKWLFSKMQGRPGRRDELDRAWARADDEARKRRTIEEFASRQRRQLLEAPCVRSTDVLPFPSYRKDH